MGEVGGLKTHLAQSRRHKRILSGLAVALRKAFCPWTWSKDRRDLVLENLSISNRKPHRNDSCCIRRG